MYLLITPAKDEETNIPNLVKAVLNQTVKPNLWVIVDDNSSDKTSYLIQELCSEHSWIKPIKTHESSEYDWLRYGSVVKFGFEYAINYSKNHNISYDFLGILDADIFIEDNYFELLIKKLNQNPQIGIISGTLYIDKDGTITPEDDSDKPRGGSRLYRRSCFEEINGFPSSPSPDAISDLKAQNRGWLLARVPDSKGLHNRRSSSKKGLWSGYSKLGESFYFLNYHPINAFLTGIYFSVRPPFYCGIAYILGYIIKLLSNSPKTSDTEVKEYFWQSWNRLKTDLFSRL